jgi:hypothetical protein
VENLLPFSCKGLSVKEDYDHLCAVHSFDVEIFEFLVVLFLLLSSNVESAFTEAQSGSTLTALCFEIVYSLLRKNLILIEFS